MALAGFRKREGGKIVENNQGRPDQKICLYCKAIIPADSQYCQYCGKKQVAVYTNTFYRNGRDESVFIQSINAWFAANRSAANIKAAFRFRKQLGLVAPVSYTHLTLPTKRIV